MNKTIQLLGLLAILPMFTIGVTTNNAAFAQDEIDCLEGEVVVVRVTNPNPICVEENTALKWVQYGIAAIVEEHSAEDVEKAYETIPGEDVQEMAEDVMEEQAEEIHEHEQAAMEEAVEEAMEEAHEHEEAMEETMEEDKSMKAHHGWMSATGTMTSVQDPGLGHETHQLAIILPPTDKVYKGILSYDASEPIQLVALHGPLAEGEDKGQPIWTPDGETKFALTLVDPENAMGSWLFTGNALAVHTMNEDAFTVSYSVSYMEKDMSDTVTTATLSSMQDPGLGHETHQLAILLPPSEQTYSGLLTYSASEPIQLVALHGPLAEGEDAGQAIWTPDGETKFALTLVDDEDQMGTWTFAGNALAVHTMNEDAFTVSYSVVAGQN